MTNIKMTTSRHEADHARMNAAARMVEAYIAEHVEAGWTIDQNRKHRVRLVRDNVVKSITWNHSYVASVTIMVDGKFDNDIHLVGEA